eukprot:scaffold11383_cov287-Chaetoceros_neogracile.AAC.1
MKAWKRRVQQGLLAKDGGGAICRHHPRLGRRGKDLILNRKGHILGVIQHDIIQQQHHMHCFESSNL